MAHNHWKIMLHPYESMYDISTIHLMSKELVT